jgi:hypothetical protein
MGKSLNYLFLDQENWNKFLITTGKCLINNILKTLPETQPAAARNPLSHSFLLKKYSGWMTNCN